MYKFSAGPVPYNPSVEALLKTAQLPVEDLQDADYQKCVRLFTLEQDDLLVGVVGIELHDHYALLRSLAIAQSARGQGLGVLLMRHAEDAAVALGVKELYLLTTTATDFFNRLGYGIVERTEAPESIAQSKQFAGICPASATFMSKQLAQSISQ